jgi:hypothetical protein
MASGVITPSMASYAIAPVEQEEEDVDLNEAEDEIHEDNEEDVGFDVVENITADVYQQRRLECEAIKLQLIESNWTVTTKSGNSELVWTVTSESIPSESPSEEFSSKGIRNVKWETFNFLSSIAKSGKKILKCLNLTLIFFFRSGQEIGRSNLLN